METRVRLALAVGGGYLLGRTKKLKLALSVGSLVAGRKLSDPNVLLGQGIEMLRSNPEFDQLRERVLGAGKSAAIAAASSQMDRATKRIGGRADALSGTDSDQSSEERDNGHGRSDRAPSSGNGSRRDSSEDESSPPERPRRRQSAPAAESGRRRSSSGSASRPSRSSSSSKKAPASKSSASGKASATSKASTPRPSSGRGASSGGSTPRKSAPQRSSGQGSTQRGGRRG
jgi:hypothetical protein